MARDDKEREAQIRLLQQSLGSIRKIAGWTTEELGYRIGVTKQTISNLENSKTPLSFTQYIAIRSVLDYEIENHKENEVLSKVVPVLLDSKDEFSEDEYIQVRETVDTTAASAAGGVKGKTLMSIFVALSSSLGIGALVATAGGVSWLKKLLSK